MAITAGKIDTLFSMSFKASAQCYSVPVFFPVKEEYKLISGAVK